MKEICSIILPIYNEKDNIPIILKRILNSQKKIKNFNLKIIFVDDNSTDGSTECLKKLNKKYKKKISVIFRKKKRSLVDSFNEGIKLSKSKFLIWMDADLSHPPELIVHFFSYYKKNNVDVISFSRFLKKSKRSYGKDGKLLIDYFSNFLNYICKKFFFKDFTDYTSGFIFIKKKIITNKLYGFYGDYFINLITDLKLKNYKVIELPYKENIRVYGKSKTTAGKLKFFIKCLYYLKSFLINFLKIRLKS